VESLEAITCPSPKVGCNWHTVQNNGQVGGVKPATSPQQTQKLTIIPQTWFLTMYGFHVYLKFNAMVVGGYE